MRTALTVLFLLVIFTHAEENDNSVITNLATFNLEEERTKINNTCLTPKDYMELTGNIVASHPAQIMGKYLLTVCIDTIGLNELRAAIGLPPLGPWTTYKNEPFSEERWEREEAELKKASTVLEYYKLKEPQDQMRSLDSDTVLESNMATGMAFMEKRFPAMRKIYNYQYGKILEKSGGVVGKAEVDRMVGMFYEQSSEFYYLLNDYRLQCR